MTDDLKHLDSSPSEPRMRIEEDPGGRRGRTGAGSTERQIHLSDYVRILYKRRWIGITAFLLVVLVTAVNTYTATNMYEAKTRLLVESGDQKVVKFQEVVDEDRGRPDYYTTQHNIMQSRALARKTLDALKLWDHGYFGGKSGVFVQAKPGIVRRVVRAVRGVFRSAPSDSATPAENQIAAVDETAAESRAIDAFLGRLTVSPIRNSRLVDIKYRLPDPVLATQIVNALAKAYIDQNLEFKFMASQEATDWLGLRLAEQRKEVQEAEANLQRYREQTDAISLADSENIVVQKLTDLNAAVTQAKMQRIQKEALYQQLRASQANPAQLDTFPAILSNGYIQQLKVELAGLQQQLATASERFGDKHPDLVKLRTSLQISQNKLNGEIAKVVQSVQSEYQSALSQEQSLTSALNTQKAEAQSMNRKAIPYSVLAREVQSTQQIYDSLLQRAKETGVSGELRSSNIRVVDPAERPRGPVSPNRQRSMMMAVAGGMLLAFVLVFFFEYMDSRMKNPEDIKALGIPHLGLLPIVNAKTLAGGYPLLSTGVPANFSEAFRAIRTNVLFSTATHGARSVVVTSTGPGEGKSMVACNMAVALAQAGQRVLLIDADMRKPKVHAVFDVPMEPGLSNLLVGNAKASESVRKMPVSGLWVLPAGLIPPNPSELLGSQRLRDFIHSLGQHFDWVIIDSPPVMAVTDAALIAHHATGVLFVVGSEMTSRHAAARALDQLENAQARFIGAVLNRVDLERNAFYYSQYYRREYARYYTTT